jgi:amidophosphoribosyltransferase
MCGIVGLIATSNVNQSLYDALIALQHRGQDAAGMMTFDQGRLFLRKGKGLVRDVFQQQDMLHLQGNMGIGHVRYPTAGTQSQEEAQPFYVNSPYGISLAHNGNLTNTIELSDELFKSDLRHLNTHSDSEVLLNVFAHELQQLHKIKMQPKDVFQAVSAVHKRCQGAYAVVAMIANYGIVAFRDPHGIRPLVYGRRETELGADYLFASESVALDALDFELIADVQPGEAVFIDMQGNMHKKQCAAKPQLNPCMFEYVYLARPDSVIDNVLVYKVRLRMGEKLGEKIKQQHPDWQIDVVMPIPDTSRTAAIPLSKNLGVKCREGFVKNRYIGRTFIMPGQQKRKKSVRQKLNTIGLEFKNKNVLLVDDSIVRGTTCKEIVRMARKAGANKVYFASAAPEVRYPNVYGIDMPTRQELIAYNRTVEQMRQEIDADGLVFQDLHVLIEACQEGNAAITKFENSVFDGCYVTGTISDAYLQNIEKTRKS